MEFTTENCLKKLQLLELCCLMLTMSFRVDRATEMSGTVNCRADSEGKIECTWLKGDNMEDGSFSLQIELNSQENYDIWKTEEDECALVQEEDRANYYYCTIDTGNIFSPFDNYTILLGRPIGGSSAENKSYTVLLSEFIPFLNIKCNPPYNVLCSFSENKYIIVWNVSGTLKDKLRYELRYKTEDAPWEKAKSKQLNNSIEYIAIEASELETDARYQAQVRCKTSEMSLYRSEWSEWSPQIAFNTTAAGFSQRQDTIRHKDMGFLLILLLLAMISTYLFVNLKFSSRIKIALSKNIPTPTAFFQPLYGEYRGNFQTWTRPRDSCKQDVKGVAEVEKKNEEELATCYLLISNVQAEPISHITYFKPLHNDNRVAPREEACTSFSDTYLPFQQYVGRNYVRKNEVATGLISCIGQGYCQQNAVPSAFNVTIGAASSQNVPDKNLITDLQTEQESFPFQESFESESCCSCSNDYSALL
uniref:Interleukin-9 receptor-like n=1 Tax=Geotrypetes seraphini TaxID=260995 RepID=A0A6P8SLJ7_GEOSA|nr:interleukin-9 receptor-like [Geotrypetes seraphini]